MGFQQRDGSSGFCYRMITYSSYVEDGIVVSGAWAAYRQVTSGYNNKNGNYANIFRLYAANAFKEGPISSILTIVEPTGNLVKNENSCYYQQDK